MGHLKVEAAKEYTTSLLGIFSTKGVDSFEKGEREKESELWLQSYVTAPAAIAQIPFPFLLSQMNQLL